VLGDQGFQDVNASLSCGFKVSRSRGLRFRAYGLGVSGWLPANSPPEADPSSSSLLLASLELSDTKVYEPYIRAHTSVLNPKLTDGLPASYLQPSNSSSSLLSLQDVEGLWALS